MGWFNLPAQCIFDKDIPTNLLLKQIGNKSESFRNQITSEVDSCRLFACINEATYPIDCSRQKDSCLNEILFLHIRLQSHINIDLLTKNILRAFRYQTVIIYQYEDKYCLAAGTVRDAKIIIENRKVEHYSISTWLSSGEIAEFNVCDIEKIDLTSYESIYNSIYTAIHQIGKEHYIPLTFVTKLYSYTLGMETDLSIQIELQNKLKERFPQNCFVAKSGIEIYRFSEDEVYELINADCGYVNGDDLIETLYQFCEFEDDFELRLPAQLKERVDEYKSAFFDGIEKIMTEDIPNIDYYEWLDESELT